MAEAGKEVAGPVFSLAPYHLKGRLNLCIRNDLFWHRCIGGTAASNSFQ